jgi:energy-coupling factor transport system permease protein
MKSITLYEYKNSPLNHLDPFSKLLYILTVLIIPIILGITNTKLLFIGISLFLLAISKILKKIVPLLTFSGIIIITAVIIQGMFYVKNVNIAITIGPIKFYKEGLLFAYHIYNKANRLNRFICSCRFFTSSWLRS